MIAPLDDSQGIELRDWFAGLAMHALFSNEGSMAVIAGLDHSRPDVDPFEAIGECAYRVADGMLNASVEPDPESN